MQLDKASLIWQLAKQAVHELEHPVPTIPTGLSKLDDLLDGGLRPGEVFVLGARPRVGKSAAGLQVILNNASKGRGVGLWSYEMQPQAWFRRAVCSQCGVNPKKVRRGEKYLSHEELNAYITAVGQVQEYPILFANRQHGFMLEAEMFKTRGCELLVVDYLQLMPCPEPAFTREHEVARISAMVKQAAMDLSIPIVLLAQLNRNAEGKVPSLADLRESGAVEQDADEVFFIHRELDQQRHVLSNRGMGILAKNRDGEAGSFPIEYDWKRFQFVEARKFEVA